MTNTKEQQALIQLISESLKYKADNDSRVELYWDSLYKPEQLSEQGLLWALDQLGNEGVIKSRKISYEAEKIDSTRTRVSVPTPTHNRAVYILEIDRGALAEYSKPPVSKYWIEMTKDRRIVLNGKYVLSKPNFASSNHNFIEFAIEHPNTIITKEMLGLAKIEVRPVFKQIISDLGFEGELKKLFFPQVSITAVSFRNNITEQEFEVAGVDIKILEKQLSKLKKVKEVRGKSRN